ncbi:dihydropteroate synthase [Thiolapillus brandeum]|uniref:Dihydropteroate synthase n=1 Tax=Thiolapillus brandeum TaxID=1076588 RepID=A0A7U6GJ35_9GAMM|nr:dihydropteroate synthase [Thiolapillus brandeum]BAO44628.1 dihydropteroate synthase [Thiolapillus brandeum]
MLNCNGRLLDLSSPVVMGILNVTPDSFSDGGRYVVPDAAVAAARAMQDNGAAIIDIGGESTRPGAEPVSVQEEMDRVVPVIEALRELLDIPLSIDTSKPEVMEEAVKAGAGMINDVNALRASGAVEMASALSVPVCLMHMQGEPRTMQQAPRYGDVVAEVKEFLRQRIRHCETAGIPRENILVDPGFGFGKTLEHNLALLRALSGFCELGAGVLAGLSRKSMLGALTGREAHERLAGSIAAAVLAAERGAAIVRVHDVAETVDALTIVNALTGVQK